MKNKQDYYYNIFWRLLLVVCIYLYTYFGYEHLAILYDSSVSNFTLISGKIGGVIPNILNYTEGSYTLILWSSIFFLAPFLLFRKYNFYVSLLLTYIFICFSKTDPLTNSIGTETLIMMLIISAFIKIPYKKIDIEATERNIHTSELIFLAMWVNFCMYYFYSGYMKLVSYSWQTGQTLIYISTNPHIRTGIALHIYNLIPDLIKKIMTYYVVFDQILTPLALLHDKIRSKIWYSIVILQIGLLIFMNLSDIQVIMLIYSLMVFDPAWILGKKVSGEILVYYDGYCALCHDFVKHVINIDNNNIVYFKPIQESLLMEDKDYVQNGKINSIVISNSGENYIKTEALIFLYRSIGGMFRVLAFFMSLAPKTLADRIYNLISTNRYRVFGKKTETCPIVPDNLNFKFR